MNGMYVCMYACMDRWMDGWISRCACFAFFPSNPLLLGGPNPLGGGGHAAGGRDHIWAKWVSLPSFGALLAPRKPADDLKQL